MTERMFRVHFDGPVGVGYFYASESDLSYEISVALRMGYEITGVEFAS